MILIPENAEGPGVRLWKAGKPHPTSTGPAIEAIERVEADIAADRLKRQQT